MKPHSAEAAPRDGANELRAAAAHRFAQTHVKPSRAGPEPRLAKAPTLSFERPEDRYRARGVSSVNALADWNQVIDGAAVVISLFRQSCFRRSPVPGNPSINPKSVVPAPVSWLSVALRLDPMADEAALRFKPYLIPTSLLSDHFICCLITISLIYFRIRAIYLRSRSF